MKKIKRERHERRIEAQRAKNQAQIEAQKAKKKKR
jgi:hypothetical protein